ncbi:sensor histidine kinase [Pleomorphovibrio marinus]|uniref:sensor histidine kinase n=1 Tax=Pleomorphovibrio marinus TaxID=2164132 RepID=UPI000E0B32F9|nr:ATP-binding protein [Pleomorphovibrio marinus]
MNLWQRYQSALLSKFQGLSPHEKGLEFWRDYLFIATITYILPLSLIALIPGIIISIHEEFYTIAFFDIFACLGLLVIAFNRKLDIQIKKVLFVSIVYALAFVLLTTLGSFGPGLVYLLAVSVFMVIIFPYKYAFISIWINIAFCILYGIIIYTEVFEIHRVDENMLLSWFAISSNLIFLDAVISILIPKLFGGMQDTINFQIKLREQLKEEQANLKRSMKELENKNQELEQFAYVASHDLQEPLRMVSSFVSLLHCRYEKLLDEKGKTYIHFALDGTKRMRQIILDLLELSRVGRNTHKVEIFSVESLIDEVKLLLRSSIQKSNATIYCENKIEIISYKSAWLQILQNLVSNSIKYRQENLSPKIWLGGKETSDGWEFFVKDNGIGIAPEYHERIFNIFQRLHTRKEFEGTGIGLSIVKKLIETMGGTIWVESELGKGSTFYFKIPKEAESNVSIKP